MIQIDFNESRSPDNKSIENYKNKEVTDMTDDKKEDLDKNRDAIAHKEAKYVKLGENYDEPDPEVVEADRKHIDMKEGGKEKSKKIPEDGEEAGEMAAETPEHKKDKKGKKSKDMEDFMSEITERFDLLAKENEKLRKDITEMNSDKIAEKKEIQESLINDMSNKYMIPAKWLKEKAEKYDNTEDFIQDFYEGLSFAFGTLPEHEVEVYKKEDMESGLLSEVEGL